MDRFFAPRSLAIYGLSRRPGNTARVIVDNCRRWGFRGPIVGINPQAAGDGGDDLDIRASAADLPFSPDLAVLLIPARQVPAAVEDCGRAGIRRLAIQADSAAPMRRASDAPTSSIQGICICMVQ